nr:uncharacterized protein LOC105155259 [Ipomoea batatas]
MKTKGTSSEETCSRSLGSTDTFSTAYLNENGGESRQGAGKIDLWSDLFKINKDTVGASAALKYFPPINGCAQLELNEILTIKEQWGFALLGCFVGRFPGIHAIQTLVKEWKVECKFFTRPNGHVLFRFQSEEDRSAILKDGPYFLFGKRLFLKSLPEKFRLENEDFSILPIWVRFPFLPIECWSPTALGKIASCIGIPICADERTREQRMGRDEFARILIDVDTSKSVPDSVVVNMPNGDSLRQKVTFEQNPCYCTKCKSNDHLMDDCTGIKPWTKKRNKKGKAAKWVANKASSPNNSVNKGQDTLGAASEYHTNIQEPCHQANDASNPCTDLPCQSMHPEPCPEAMEALEPCSDLPSNIASIPENEDQRPDNASSDEAAKQTEEDTQSVTGEGEERDGTSSLDGNESINADQGVEPESKQPNAPEPSTSGMSTRSKVKAGPKTSFKNALLSPPKDKGTAGGSRAGNRFVPLPVGGKPLARGGGRRQATSGSK